MTRANALTWQQHAALINEALRDGEIAHAKEVQAWVKAGRRIQAAMDQLNYGDYCKMFTDSRHRIHGCGQDKAERLRAIAADPVISDSAHARNLPSSWYTLYLLTKIKSVALKKQMLADGRIHPDLERKDIEDIIKKLRRPTGTVAILIAKLATVQPAVAINQMLPLLTCFWFTGRQLMAYNDAIALAVPYRSDFSGAVPGLLLPWLKLGYFNDRKFKITAADAHLQVTDDRTSFTLAMLGDRFSFSCRRGRAPIRSPAK
jgi:hypothetical protein